MKRYINALIISLLMCVFSLHGGNTLKENKVTVTLIVTSIVTVTVGTLLLLINKYKKATKPVEKEDDTSVR